jgi:subtilase family serine protease
MTELANTRKLTAFALAVIAVSIVASTPASAESRPEAVSPARAISNNKPSLQALRREDPNKSMDVTVALNLRNQKELDELVKAIHDPNSPSYHKFISREEFASRFAPTAADSKTIQDYLTRHGLKVTYADKFNVVVRATGTVENLEKAFSTQVGVFEDRGQQFNKPLVEPRVEASVSSLVKSVGGFTTVKAHSFAVRPLNVKTGKPLPGVEIKTHKSGLFFPSDCFETESPLTLKGTGLEGIYSGNGYANAGCGYDPAELQHAYGFDTVISGGLNGAGQTIVIVDAYGSYTLAADVAEFDSLYGLPAINLNIIYNPTGGTPDCVVANGVQCGWEGETTLDVEWAHAMAPNATIDLIVSPTAEFSDLGNIDLWAAEVIAPASASHSFGFPEWLLVDYYGDTTDYLFQYDVNFIADQIFGVSNNYATGDDGDYYTLGEDLIPDVSFPSGSPNATAVGGTSLALAANGSYKWENGWGTNAAWLNTAPPTPFGFIFGGGGGTSSVTAAPAWQSTFLGNTYRQQPDVAFDADPYTGVEIVITPDSVAGDPQYVEVIGGTSLATPLFSGTWALVAQKAGGNLGNAAPLLYAANAANPGVVTDVQPVYSGANAHGTIFYNGIPTSYSQWQLAAPYQNSELFWESIWSAGGGYYYTLTFGTDSSLFTAPGWDNVTGIGTPNGAKFVAPF